MGDTLVQLGQASIIISFIGFVVWCICIVIRDLHERWCQYKPEPEVFEFKPLLFLPDWERIRREQEREDKLFEDIEEFRNDISADR